MGKRKRASNPCTSTTGRFVWTVTCGVLVVLSLVLSSIALWLASTATNEVHANHTA
jgi:hypothetical protein